MTSPQTRARDRIENLWDRATPVGPLLDAYRDEVHVASIQDAIDRLHRIERLAPDGERAPGINFAIGALMSIRDQKPTASALTT